MNKADFSGVFVFIEQREKIIQNVSLELLGKARELADDLDQDVVAVLLGYQVEDIEKLSFYGADRVIYSEHSDLDNFMTEPYTKVMMEIVGQKRPEILLFGATAIGRDLAPRLACRAFTGLTADCTSLAIDDETKDLMMTRPAFGGNIMATIICPEHRPQMATVRPGVMKKAEFDTENEVNILAFPTVIRPEDKTYEILEIVHEKTETMDIQEAKILVSGGRGVGHPDNFEILNKVALELGGTVASSRAVVDSGWQPKERQVGQTGKTVRPNLYLACGISGAIQHLAGMEESECIIAINKDETAPIFEVSDLGIVGDLNKILPLLGEEIKKVKMQNE
jgi:electron transfer flavoprotein alpha subunit